MPRLLPGRAAQLHLGRLGQRHGAGRAARAGPGASTRPTPCSPRLTWPPGTRASRQRPQACGRASRRRQRPARPPSNTPGGWPGQITVTLQAALLVRHAPAPVADAFCASRLGCSQPAAGGRAGRAVRQPAGRARPPSILVRLRLLPYQVRSTDANLAGRRVPARRDLGRLGHQLRPVLRGRRAGRAVPVRRAPATRRGVPAHRGRRLRLALATCRQSVPASATATASSGPTTRARATAATRPSCSSIRTARPSRAACAGTSRCSPTSSQNRAKPNEADSAPFMPRNVVINPYFDWAGDRAAAHALPRDRDLRGARARPHHAPSPGPGRAARHLLRVWPRRR